MGNQPIRVFLADDTLIAREGWKKILETVDDIQVAGEASTAQEVLRKVLECTPDVLLMDLKWFGDDIVGWTTIREVKTVMPKLKIIAITAYESLIRDARLAGADAALTKTFSREELINMIREISTHQTNKVATPLYLESDFMLPGEDLSPREYEVLKLLESGKTDRQIAESLTIAVYTVKNHVKNIREKLGAKNRTEAVSIARSKGILY